MLINKPNFPRYLVVRYLFFFFGLSVTCSLALNETLTGDTFQDRSGVSLRDMVYGTADRPFVYRALTPMTVRILTQLTPEFIKQKIEMIWQSRGLVLSTTIAHENAVEGFWTILLMLASLFGFALSLLYFLQALYHPPPLVFPFAVTLAVTCVPVFQSYYMYDFPVLFLFTLCLALLVRGNWPLYYVVFALACFAKETAILLPFLCFVIFIKYRHKRILFHTIIQSSIWLIIFATLRFIYRDNPGMFLQFHLFDYNLPLLFSPSMYLNVNKYLMPTNVNILLLIVLAVAVFWGWKEKPELLKLSSFILIPLLGMSMLFGLFFETRGYYEAYPIIYALGMHSVMRVFDVHHTTQDIVLLQKKVN